MIWKNFLFMLTILFFIGCAGKETKKEIIHEFF